MRDRPPRTFFPFVVMTVVAAAFAWWRSRNGRDYKTLPEAGAFEGAHYDRGRYEKADYKRGL
jgi:hypothetical protein